MAVYHSYERMFPIRFSERSLTVNISMAGSNVLYDAKAVHKIHLWRRYLYGSGTILLNDVSSPLLLLFATEIMLLFFSRFFQAEVNFKACCTFENRSDGCWFVTGHS